MLIFYIRKYFKSQVLLTKMTLYLVSKQVINLELESSGRYLKMKMIIVMVYVKPLNTSPELKNWYIALKAMIEIEKAASISKKGEVTFK